MTSTKTLPIVMLSTAKHPYSGMERSCPHDTFLPGTGILRFAQNDKCRGALSLGMTIANESKPLGCAVRLPVVAL